MNIKELTQVIELLTKGFGVEKQWKKQDSNPKKRKNP